MKRKAQITENDWSTDFQNALRHEMAAPSLRNNLFRWLRQIWIQIVSRSTKRQNGLHLVEMVGLGEKRFVAVVEYQNERFLLGGAPASVSLLSQLQSPAHAYASQTSYSATVERGARRAKKTSLSAAEARQIVTLLNPSPADAQPRKRKSATSATTTSVERLA